LKVRYAIFAVSNVLAVLGQGSPAPILGHELRVYSDNPSELAADKFRGQEPFFVFWVWGPVVECAG
jgi:hypothetical protein